MSDHSRKTAPNSGNGVAPDVPVAAASPAHGFGGVHADPMLSLQPRLADTPSEPSGPSPFLPGIFLVGLLTRNAKRRASASSSRPARGARIAYVAWAASGTPVLAIDGGVVPPNDLEPAAALYFGLQQYAPAGKETTCTQEGGHVKASSKKIRAPSIRRKRGPGPRDA